MASMSSEGGKEEGVVVVPHQVVQGQTTGTRALPHMEGVGMEVVLVDTIGTLVLRCASSTSHCI